MKRDKRRFSMRPDKINIAIAIISTIVTALVVGAVVAAFLSPLRYDPNINILFYLLPAVGVGAFTISILSILYLYFHNTRI